LRDRTFIALLVYTFARVSAAVNMNVEDVYVQGKRTWVRLHEKGGKEHALPCHHELEEYLDAYMDTTSTSGQKVSPSSARLLEKRERLLSGVSTDKERGI
jgi:integrase/recombinase XerD